LTLDCFSFGDDNHHKQLDGVAMGTKMGPSFANLFVSYIENQLFNQFNGTKPELYGRYIDDCIGATLSKREELDHFITSVNSFHPALKYTWEISETSIALLDIKVSINGNGLSTSVHYKPTDSNSYCRIHPLIPPTSKTPSRTLNFLDIDVYVVMTPIFPTNQEMRHFFKKRGYPDSVVNTAQHRTQQIDRQSALQTSQKEKNERIPFTFTYPPRNLAAKNIIFKNLKLLQNDNETGGIFSQPPLISFIQTRQKHGELSS